MSWNRAAAGISSNFSRSPQQNAAITPKNGIASLVTKSDDGFSSDDDSLEENEQEDQRASLDNLESSIFQGYIFASQDQLLGAQAPQALSKIRDLLVAARIGAISCLICLEKVRISDPIWDCKTGCHGIYHLICIQAWATEECKSAVERSRARFSQEHFPALAVQSASWHCPKCRIEYARADIPCESKCYCGKVVDPPIDHWLTAHSCGQICERPLGDGCGHECKLLCHPGACPPCPQFVKAKCFCGTGSDVRRCSHKQFSCGRLCGKKLPCGIHQCEDVCHGGACPPCKKSGLHSCRCGRARELRPCSEFSFLCEQPCGKPLQCKKHWCEKICHAGPCGECELQGKQRCPCGKVEYKDLSCDSVASTCGSTCEKWLQCSLHRCQERCHTGSCKTVCRIVTLKVCRCGSLKKEVPCHQDLQCERKCQRLRDCKRHPCKRRCCNGDCPPCSEICGRRLRCGNHKCPALCHRGPCAPCPLSVRISCACEATAYEVPCGAEKDKRPPRCSKPCRITPSCEHGESCQPHRCHYGACPPCELVCNKKLACGHTCKQRCHGPRPPPNVEFSLMQKKRRKMPQDTQASGSPCPPCTECILKKCLGHHEGQERSMVCSESTAFSCGRPCGNPLVCGNHLCQKVCHEIAVPRFVLEGTQVNSVSNFMSGVDSCEQCMLLCQKKRVPPCPHPCMQPCHLGDCSPCQTLIKRACYCGALVHVFTCSIFNSLSEEEKGKNLSCGGPCHRKLPNCTHMCSEICHPGSCMMAATCRKKVTIRCACQRLKKDWLCSDVQAAYSSLVQQSSRNLLGVGLLSCDDECARLIEGKKLNDNQIHLRKAAPLQIQDSPSNKVAKRRRRQHPELEQDSRFKELYQKVSKWMSLIILVMLVIIGLYFMIRGLQFLSDYMNELDAKRPRKKLGGTFAAH